MFIKAALEIVKKAIASAIKKFTPLFFLKILVSSKTPNIIARTNKNGIKVVSDCKNGIPVSIIITALILMLSFELQDLQSAFRYTLLQLVLCLFALRP